MKALTREEFLDRVHYYGKVTVGWEGILTWPSQVWCGARDTVAKALQARFQAHTSGRVVDFGTGQSGVWGVGGLVSGVRV